MIRCENLQFNYGAKPILCGASLHVRSGEMVALLGGNGVGKSTTLRLLGGLLRPQSGTIGVMGLDPIAAGPEFRRRVGVMPDGLGLFEELTLEEQLVLVGRLHGLGRVECEVRIAELLDFLGLREARWSPARAASHGTRKKAALAMTLLPDPEVLLLDEPFEGVDPSGVQRIEQLLQALILRGRTVLFSAHDLALVQRLRPRILFITPEGTLDERDLEDLHWRDFEGTGVSLDLPPWLRSSCS